MPHRAARQVSLARYPCSDLDYPNAPKSRTLTVNNLTDYLDSPDGRSSNVPAGRLQIDRVEDKSRSNSRFQLALSGA